MKPLRTIAALVLTSSLVACGAAPETTEMTELGTQSGGDTSSRVYKVGIVQQVTHPALDAARTGIQDALTQSGLQISVEAKNAQNDAATLASITDGFRDNKMDLVFAIGTLPAQAALNSLQGSGIPIVFNALADPYKGGVAKSETEHPGITGIQALPPVVDAFDFISTIKPGVKKVGNIWTSNERNSEVATSIAREYAKSKGIEFVERQVTKADEVLQAAESLAAEKVDAIFIATDSTVVSALESVVKVANDNDIGLFCTDPASAERGCSVGLGLDYYDNGFDSAADMGVLLLKGAKVEDLPIKKQEKQLMILNTAAASEQGLVLPVEVTKQATKTFDSISPKK